MLEIYHNPRCRKSREGHAILEASGREFKTIYYLKEVPTKETLTKIITLLGISAGKLVRKNEAVWKEKYRGKELNEDEIIEAMVQHPKLIERPIIVEGDRAVLGRPPELISEFLLG